MEDRILEESHKVFITVWDTAMSDGFLEEGLSNDDLSDEVLYL